MPTLTAYEADGLDAPSVFSGLAIIAGNLLVAALHGRNHVVAKQMLLGRESRITGEFDQNMYKRATWGAGIRSIFVALYAFGLHRKLPALLYWTMLEVPTLLTLISMIRLLDLLGKVSSDVNADYTTDNNSPLSRALAFVTASVPVLPPVYVGYIFLRSFPALTSDMAWVVAFGGRGNWLPDMGYETLPAFPQFLRNVYGLVLFALTMCLALGYGRHLIAIMRADTSASHTGSLHRARSRTDSPSDTGASGLANRFKRRFSVTTSDTSDTSVGKQHRNRSLKLSVTLIVMACVLDLACAIPYLRSMILGMSVTRTSAFLVRLGEGLVSAVVLQMYTSSKTCCQD